MKTLLPLAALSAVLSACGTGILPPVTKALPDINVTLPPATSTAPVVVYLSQNQFADLPAVSGVVNSVSITGDLVYTVVNPASNLSNVGIYIRQNLDGQNCYNQSGYLICGGDESAYKLQDLEISKGLTVKTVISGKLLNAAVKNKSGYIGFRINQGNTTQGDKLSITGVVATVQF